MTWLTLMAAILIIVWPMDFIKRTFDRRLLSSKKTKLKQTCNYFTLRFVDKQIFYFITDRTHFVFSEHCFLSIYSAYGVQVREVSGTFHKICFLKNMHFAGSIQCSPVL